MSFYALVLARLRRPPPNDLMVIRYPLSGLAQEVELVRILGLIAVAY